MYLMKMFVIFYSCPSTILGPSQDATSSVIMPNFYNMCGHDKVVVEVLSQQVLFQILINQRLVYKVPISYIQCQHNYKPPQCHYRDLWFITWNRNPTLPSPCKTIHVLPDTLHHSRVFIQNEGTYRDLGKIDKASMLTQELCLHSISNEQHVREKKEKSIINCWTNWFFIENKQQADRLNCPSVGSFSSS